MSTTIDHLSIVAPAPTSAIATALRTESEEFEAAMTHGVGAVIAVVASIYLVRSSTEQNEIWCTLGCLIYSFALVGVLAASTLSHLRLSECWNRRFRAFDQGFIYLLAAGSLAPFALTFLRTPVWLTYFAVVLLMATVGFVSKVVFYHRVDQIALSHYLAVGWTPAIALAPLQDHLPQAAISWIVAGFACYCVGIIFLVSDVRRLRFHSIWHLMVLAACSCHYLSILRYVVHAD